MNNQFSKSAIATGLFVCFAFAMQAQTDATNAVVRTDSLVGNLINVSKSINTAVVAVTLNDKVNSRFVESGPILTKDGKRLYFSRYGHPDNIGGVEDMDIWFSEFDDATQSWSEAINVGAPLNNEGPNFLCGVGWKGDTVLLGNVYNKKGKMKAGISLSIKSGDVWSFPVPVYVSNDYNLADKVSYDLSHDRNALVIAEQKENSNGKLDLYVAFRQKNAKNPYSGTESVNMGPTINSFGNETSPFLAYDGKTIYFSSDGYNGYGGLDIFMSKRLDDTWTNWSKPENLGPGINTPYDDAFFGFTPNNRFAYYARGIASDNSDIYQVDMTYLFKPTPTADLKKTEDPGEVGQTKVVKHAFNDNSKDINKEVLTELDNVVKYMKLYKNVEVQVSAHSNKHATRDESLKLSTARANKVMEYLVKNGVEKGRLKSHGFGHDVVANTTSTTTAPSKETSNDIASSVEFRYVGTGK